MSNQRRVPSVQAETGQNVGRQQLTPPVVTEIRTATTSIYEGGVLNTPALDVIGTADPGASIQLDDTAGTTRFCQTGADGIWISGRLILEKGEHVFTAFAYTSDPPAEPVQSPPFSINVAIGDRFRIDGLYVFDVSDTPYPCGSIIPIVSSPLYPLRLAISGQAGTRVQMANSGQSPDIPAPESPLWGVEHTIGSHRLTIEVTPVGLLPIGNWFHVRTVDEGLLVTAKCLANFVRVG